MRTFQIRHAVSHGIPIHSADSTGGAAARPIQRLSRSSTHNDAQLSCFKDFKLRPTRRITHRNLNEIHRIQPWVPRHGSIMSADVRRSYIGFVCKPRNYRLALLLHGTSVRRIRRSLLRFNRRHRGLRREGRPEMECWTVVRFNPTMPTILMFTLHGGSQLPCERDRWSVDSSDLSRLARLLVWSGCRSVYGTSREAQASTSGTHPTLGSGHLNPVVHMLTFT